MSPIPLASIIICTCNRAASLAQTLESLEAGCGDVSFELLVVDNASNDSTAQVVDSFAATASFPVKYLFEPRRGQSNARNTGLQAATGEIAVFIDDDIHPDALWLARLCGPITSGDADAVSGGVKIAGHLERTWMSQQHRAWLADTSWLLKAPNPEMIGANMAFDMAVLSRVPAFDPELGPGASGFGDDSLFSWQLREAGYRLIHRPDIAVEHHFDPDRLRRESFLKQAICRGKTRAYLTRHWLQETVPQVGTSLLQCKLKLAIKRAIAPRWNHPEGMADWEMELIRDVEFYRQYRIECDRGPWYDLKGLAKHHDATTKKGNG